MKRKGVDRQNRKKENDGKGREGRKNKTSMTVMTMALELIKKGTDNNPCYKN